eukprot:jgi/Hompol1/2160/HPOL_002091-RA
MGRSLVPIGYLGALLVWTHASVLSTKSYPQIRARVELCIQLITAVLDRLGGFDDCETDIEIRRTIFEHDLIKELFLNGQPHGVERLLSRIEPSDNISVTAYVAKLWLYLEQLLETDANEDDERVSAAALDRLQVGINNLVGFIPIEHMNSKIEALLSLKKSTATHDRVLFILVAASFSASKTLSSSVHIHRKLFQKLLSALVHNQSEVSVLISQLVAVDKRLLSGDLSQSPVTICPVTGTCEIQRSGHSHPLRIEMPLDIWSVLEPDSLAKALESSSDYNLVRFALSNAVSSVPHAIQLLKLLLPQPSRVSKSSKRVAVSTESKISTEWRILTVRALVLAWTVMVDDTPAWITHLPLECTSLLTQVAASVCEIELTAVRQKILGKDLDSDAIEPCGGQTLATIVHLFANSQSAGWLRTLISDVLASTPSNPRQLLASVASSWPAFSIIVRANNASDVFLGDLALYVLRHVYNDLKRSEIDTETAKQVAVLIGGFQPSSDGSFTININNSMAVVKKFIVACLKHRLADPDAMLLLRRLVQMLYHNQTARPELFSAEDLVNMIVSHSQYDELLAPINRLDTEALSKQLSCPIPASHPGKTSMLWLLHSVMAANPLVCCKLEILPKLVASYYGTVSPSDRSASLGHSI